MSIHRDATLEAACNTAARVLPDGWVIEIQMERGYGDVLLFNHDGDEVDYPSNSECIADKLGCAIAQAIECNRLRNEAD